MAALEETLQSCAENWGFTPGLQRHSGLDGYVVDALMDDGTSTVVKVRRPDEMMRREADALMAFDGRRVVRLLARNDELGAMLLERAAPGTQLAACLDEVSADELVCELVEAWSGLEAPESAVELSVQAERWADNMDNFVSLNFEAPLPAKDFARGAEQLRRLAVSQSGVPQLLHGDIHVGDVILSDEDGWVAVDPKGLRGEAIFDLAWWLRDPPLGLNDADSMEAPLKARLAAITNTGAEAERCLAWAQACAVVLVAARCCALSAWDARRHAACAEALQRL